MFTQPEYAELDYKVIKELTTQLKADTEYSVSQENLISVNAKPYYVSHEAADGKITFKGFLVYSIIIKVEGGCEKVEKREDFEGKIEDDCIIAGAKCFIKFESDGVECVFNGDNADFSCVINVNCKFYESKNVKYVCGGNGLSVLASPVEVCKHTCSVSRSFDIEDEFEINNLYKDVLSYDSVSYVMGVKCAVGRIVVDGNVILSLCLLPFSQNSDIIKERREIPFRLEIDCDEVNPDSFACIAAVTRKTALKVFVDEEKNKTTVSGVVTVCLAGDVFNCEQVSVSCDAYSDKCVTDCKYTVACMQKFDKTVGGTNNVFSKAVCDVPENSRFVCNFDDNLTGLNYSLSSGVVEVSGTVQTTVLFNVDGELIARAATAPFSFVLPFDGDEIKMFGGALLKCNGKMRSGAIEMDCEVFTQYVVFKNDNITLLGGIAEGKEREEITAPISVYLPGKGSTMWQLCKDVCMCEEEILKLNPDLTFPLTGNERIIIYRR